MSADYGSVDLAAPPPPPRRALRLGVGLSGAAALALASFAGRTSSPNPSANPLMSTHPPASEELTAALTSIVPPVAPLLAAPASVPVAAAGGLAAEP